MAGARRALTRRGVPCRVVNTDRRAPDSSDYFAVRGARQLLSRIVKHALTGWTIHVHTNGHNPRGWLLSLLCGIAARIAPLSVLTLHSGLTPSYLSGASPRLRLLALTACRLYRRIICVNPEIRDAVAALGMSRQRIDVIPAFLNPARPEARIAPPVLNWLEHRKPLLSTVLWFRPEYGFDLLIEAVKRLRARLPELGLLVMGDNRQPASARAQITSAGLQDCVLLLGDTPHETCLTLIARSDLFVRATFADGDAISIREALSLGIPVVASDVVPRPGASLLFRSGDVEDLVSVTYATLSGRNPPLKLTANLCSSGTFGRLIEIYGQTGN
jgi:glycosyltransferase involved in cell wall biosynthesis